MDALYFESVDRDKIAELMGQDGQDFRIQVPRLNGESKPTLPFILNRRKKENS